VFNELYSENTVLCCVLSNVVYTAVYEHEMVQVESFRFRVLKHLLLRLGSSSVLDITVVLAWHCRFLLVLVYTNIISAH